MMSSAAATGVSSWLFDSFASTWRGNGRENPVIQSMCRKITSGKSRAFALVFAANGVGAIVDILSVVSWITVPISGSYCVSKAAELAMTHGIGVEPPARDTLVVGVRAGYIGTDMTASLVIKKTTPQAVVSATLAALERDETEVLADDRSRDVKNRLREDLVSLDREMQSIWDDYFARQTLPPSSD
jgi:NAD(P)-dependent dehydrogenase (short-subunit alcohol dehydrogenase family)